MSSRISKVRHQVLVALLFVALSTVAVSWNISEVNPSADNADIPALVDGHQGAGGHG